LKAELFEVDASIANESDDIPASAIRGQMYRVAATVPAGNKTATYPGDDAAPRLLTTRAIAAYVEDRGRLRSPVRSPADPLMREVSQPTFRVGHQRKRVKLATQGVMVLVAQDSTRYGAKSGG